MGSFPFPPGAQAQPQHQEEPAATERLPDFPAGHRPSRRTGTTPEQQGAADNTIGKAGAAGSQEEEKEEEARRGPVPAGGEGRRGGGGPVPASPRTAAAPGS